MNETSSRMGAAVALLLVLAALGQAPASATPIDPCAPLAPPAAPTPGTPGNQTAPPAPSNATSPDALACGAASIRELPPPPQYQEFVNHTRKVLLLADLSGPIGFAQGCRNGISGSPPSLLDVDTFSLTSWTRCLPMPDHCHNAKLRLLPVACEPTPAAPKAPPPPGGLPDGLPSGLPDGIPGGVPGGLPDGVPGGVPGGIPGGVPGGVPGGIPGGVPGGLPGGEPGGGGPDTRACGNAPVSTSLTFSDQSLMFLFPAPRGSGFTGTPCMAPNDAPPLKIPASQYFQASGQSDNKVQCPGESDGNFLATGVDVNCEKNFDVHEIKYIFLSYGGSNMDAAHATSGSNHNYISPYMGASYGNVQWWNDFDHGRGNIPSKAYHPEWHPGGVGPECAESHTDDGNPWIAGYMYGALSQDNSQAPGNPDYNCKTPPANGYWGAGVVFKTTP